MSVPHLRILPIIIRVMMSPSGILILMSISMMRVIVGVVVWMMHITMIAMMMFFFPCSFPIVYWLLFIAGLPTWRLHLSFSHDLIGSHLII